MYNTIIVPTDFSNEDSTIHSLQKAERLSDSGRIILLHVIAKAPSSTAYDLPTELVQDLVPRTRDALREIIFISDIKAESEVRHGRPYNQIIKSSKEHDADLIIINSHQPGFQDYLLGSTAAKVVRHASCAVLVER